MKVRTATLADAPDLAALHALAFARPWAAAEFESLLTSTGAFAILAGEAEPAGLILCRVIAGEAEVLTVAVAPAVRRSGVAKALMAAAIGMARTDGAREMLLEVGIDNAPAIGLYSGLGFTRAGLRKGYYGRGAEDRTDAVVMRLDLPAFGG